MRVNRTLKSNFLAGLAIVGPVLVTVFILRLVGNWILGLVQPVVESTRLAGVTGNVFVAQVLILLLVVAGIVVIGWVAQYSVGRALFGRAGRVMNFIPVVRTVYSSIQQVTNSLTDSASRYESVVLVEYHRDGVYSIGLVTSTPPKKVTDVIETEARNVFFPGSPNPTQGQLVMVPEDRIYDTELSVGQGVQLLMTTGMAQDKSIIELDNDVVVDPEDVVARDVASEGDVS